MECHGLLPWRFTFAADYRTRSLHAASAWRLRIFLRRYATGIIKDHAASAWASRRATMGTHRRQLSFLMTLALLIVPICPTVFAQQTVTSAALSGHITDLNGALITGASVTATSVEHNQSQTTISDQNGRFRFPSLTVGTYLVAIE